MLEIVRPASPLLVKVTVFAVLVVFTIWAANVSDVGERFTIGAIPVPLKLAVGWAPVVLLFKISEPAREPRAAGVKITLTVQLLPAANGVPQLFVWEKSPDITKLPIERAVLPLLLNVMACAELEVPTSCELKASDAGENDAIAPSPVLLKVTEAGAGLLLLDSDSDPVRLPTTVGLKTTLMVQLAPAATEAPQLLVWLKSPLTVTEEMEREVFPLLVSVTACPALELPSACEGNASEEGESVATAANPVPLKVTEAGAGLLLLDNDKDPVRLPKVEGLKTTLMVQLAPAPTDVPQLLV